MTTAAPPEKMMELHDLTDADLAEALRLHADIFRDRDNQPIPASYLWREAARRLAPRVGDADVNAGMEREMWDLAPKAPPAASAERDGLAELEADLRKLAGEVAFVPYLAQKMFAAGYRKRAAQGVGEDRVKMLEETAKINLAALVLARDAVRVLERYAMHNPSCPKFKLKPGKCSCGLESTLSALPKGQEHEG